MVWMNVHTQGQDRGPAHEVSSNGESINLSATTAGSRSNSEINILTDSISDGSNSNRTNNAERWYTIPTKISNNTPDPELEQAAARPTNEQGEKPDATKMRC